MAIDVVVDPRRIEAADKIGRIAWSSRSSTPGSTMIPLCGNATIWMSIRS
jgi:hypothetical protein